VTTQVFLQKKSRDGHAAIPASRHCKADCFLSEMNSPHLLNGGFILNAHSPYAGMDQIKL